MTKAEGVLDDIYDAWQAQDPDWLASYLPDDFCHTIHIPPEMHPLGGFRRGKKACLERLNGIFTQFDLHLDTETLLIDRNHAAVEIPTHWRHRETGVALESTKAAFWTIDDGWPVTLHEYYDVGDIQSFVSAMSAQAAFQLG